MHGVTRQVAVVAAVAVNLVLNALAGAGLLFGVQTGAVSDAVTTGVTPAGWAFSIWSVIFLGTLVFGAWMVRTARDARYDGLAVPFVAANLLNGLWQVPWLLEWFPVAAAVLLAIVATLAWLYVRLDRLPLRGTERWALGVPVALWLAWTTVAAALNVTITLVAAGWTDGAVLWPVVVVVAVTGIATLILLRTGDVAFAAVVLWAFAGIAAAQAAGATRIALGVGALAVVGGTVWAVRHGRSPWPTAHGD